MFFPQDFTLQQLERRCIRMQGEHNTEEKAALEDKVDRLQSELEAKNATHFLLTNQLKRLQVQTFGRYLWFSSHFININIGFVLLFDMFQ